MNTRALATFFLSLFVVGASPLASAVPIVNNFGFANPDSIITFDEVVLPQGAIVTNQYEPLLRIAPKLNYDPSVPLNLPGISAHYLGNFDRSNSIINPFSISFLTPQASVAFGMASDPATTTFTALLAGTVVESFSEFTTYNNASKSYYGFTAIVFDEIQVSLNGPIGIAIDNIQVKAAPPRTIAVAALPEPASLGLVGLGLAALALMRRRKSRLARRTR